MRTYVLVGLLIAITSNIAAAQQSNSDKAEDIEKYFQTEKSCKGTEPIVQGMEQHFKKNPPEWVLPLGLGKLALSLCQELLSAQRQLIELRHGTFSPATPEVKEDRKTWYEKDPKPTTLRAALAETKIYLGEDNPGYRSQGPAGLCTAMKKVGLPCDYNTRWNITMFLTVNGKGLFPAAGGTNPYVKGLERSFIHLPDDTFIGQPVQNEMLRKSIERNADLFQNGDLTAEAVQKWR